MNVRGARHFGETPKCRRKLRTAREVTSEQSNLVSNLRLRNRRKLLVGKLPKQVGVPQHARIRQAVFNKLTESGPLCSRITKGVCP